MSGSLKELKNRIKSINNIYKITKAMKMTAAVRIKRAENVIKRANPFINNMHDIVEKLLISVNDEYNVFTTKRPVKKRFIIVFTSDKGLCGAYNQNVIKAATNLIQQSGENNIKTDLALFGQKAIRHFEKKNVTVYRQFENWNTSYALVQQITDIAMHRFSLKEVDEVFCVFNKPVSSLVQHVDIIKVLPIIPKDNVRKEINYYLEPSKQEVINAILESYIMTLFFEIMIKSRSGEFGARLKAMSNATDNADKCAGQLSRQYFRVRQDMITTEIIEVASGANFSEN